MKKRRQELQDTIDAHKEWEGERPQRNEFTTEQDYEEAVEEWELDEPEDLNGDDAFVAEHHRHHQHKNPI